MQDTYWSEPQAAYDERRRLYISYCAAHSPGERTGFFSQIARLELGLAPDEEAIQRGVAIARQLDDPWTLGTALVALGIVEMALGDGRRDRDPVAARRPTAGRSRRPCGTTARGRTGCR